MVPFFMMTQRAFPLLLGFFLSVPLTLYAQDASKTNEAPMRQSEFSVAEENRLNASQWAIRRTEEPVLPWKDADELHESRGLESSRAHEADDGRWDER